MQNAADWLPFAHVEVSDHHYWRCFKEAFAAWNSGHHTYLQYIDYTAKQRAQYVLDVFDWTELVQDVYMSGSRVSDVQAAMALCSPEENRLFWPLHLLPTWVSFLN